MTRGKVSIVMPFYKAEAYVEKMVKAILSQTYKDWELIAVSNGPVQDKQNEIVGRFAKEDPRIKLICTDTPGVSNARNIGISVATGKWLTFVDADDIIDSDHINYYMEAADDDSQIIVMGYTRVTPTSEHPFRVPNFDSKQSNCKNGLNEAKKRLLNSFVIVIGSPCNKLFKREFLVSRHLEFDSSISYHEDALFSLATIIECNRLQLIDRASYRYIENVSGSISRYHSSMEYASNKMNTMLIQLYEEVGMPKDFIDDKIVEKDYIFNYFCIINLYREDCPLSGKEKIKNLKRLAYNDTFKNARRKYIEKHLHGAQRFFDIGYEYLPPILFHIWLTLIFYIRKHIKR